MSINYKLTVGIISYNRPIELIRTINSLMPLPENIEVLICDDKSPKLNEILFNLKELNKNEHIRFVSNELNLGYDRNLYHVIELSNSEHVLLLGDDDYLEAGALQNVLDFIKQNKDFHCGFLRFRDEQKNKNKIKYSRFYNSSKYFHINTLEKNGSFIYTPILFSGLIFCKKPILENYSIFSKYFHSIYIQVSMFCFLNSKYGSFYINGPGVVIGGDGENGFGFNEASKNNDDDLKDRSSLISNLSYHKRLFEVIRKIEIDIKQKIYKPFLLEYKIRSVKALFEMRKLGRKNTLEYLSQLYKLNLPRIWIFTPIYLLIIYLPIAFLRLPINILQVALQKYRHFKENNVKTIR